MKLSPLFGVLLPAVLPLAVTTLAADGPVIRDGRPFPRLYFPTLAHGSLRTVESFRGTKTLLLHFASW